MQWTPSQLNQIKDDVLQAHVNAILNTLGDVNAQSPPRTSTFLTADILLRLHNIVATARRNGHLCAGWTKQAVLARVVGAFTGVRVSRADAEYIGNAQDYFLKGYVKQLTKAQRAEARAISRALKASKEPPSSDRVAELKQQVYKCKYGGVPRTFVVCDGGSENRRQTEPQQPVP